MLDLFDAMQCDFDTNPFEHIDRFHFNICINCSQNFYSDEQFASKHVSPSVSSFCVWASGWVWCVYGFLIKNPTHGHYNKIFCDEKKTYRTKMISNAFVFIDQCSKLELPTPKDRHEKEKKEREKKTEGRGKTKSLFYYFLMLPLILQHIRSSAQLWYLFSNYIINLMICDRFLIGFLLLENIRYGEKIKKKILYASSRML